MYVRKRVGGLELPCVATIVSVTHLGADVLMKMGDSLVQVMVNSYFFSKIDSMVLRCRGAVPLDTVKSMAELGFTKSELTLIDRKSVV